MNTWTVGQYIKDKRKKLGMSQTELCCGICDSMTISRLENGHNIPSTRILTALLERLGLPTDRFYALVSEEDEKIEILKEQIIDCNVEQNHLKALELLSDLKNLADKDDTITWQFILWTKAINGTADGPYPSQTELEILMDAIHLTIPYFDLHHILEYRYSLDEMKLVVRMAQVYSNIGHHELALSIYSDCYQYVMKNNQKIKRSAGLISHVAYNYARELCIDGCYKKALELANIAQEVCLTRYHYRILPETLHLKAEIYHLMGDDENGKDMTILAWSLYRILDNKKSLLKLAEDAAKYYHIDLNSYGTSTAGVGNSFEFEGK